MKKITMTIMGLFLAAVVATSAFAANGRGPGYGACGRDDFSAVRGMNLTAEQKTKITALRDSQFKDVKPLQDQMFAKRDALRKLWLEPNPDQAKIAAAQKEMNAVRDQMQEKMTAFHLASLNVLTPEQKEKVKSWGGRGGFDRKGKGGKGPGFSGNKAGCPGACFGR